MFLSVDFLLIYFIFEIVLIPTYVLIMGWGYQPERIRSRMYLLFYTVFCSLPLLVLILFLAEKFGEYNFVLFISFSYFSLWGSVVFIIGIMAFFSKIANV